MAVVASVFPRFAFTPILLAFLVFVRTAMGLVVNGETASNSSAPADDFGFANVTRVWDTADGFYATGVYVGNGWVLTAYHVIRDGNGGFVFTFPVTINGQNYNADPSTPFRLTNPSNGTLADLAMFRLQTIPSGVSGVAVSNVALSAGQSITLAGDGYCANGGEVYWDANWNTTSPPGVYQGYPWDTAPADQRIRWGLSTVVAASLNLNDGYGTQPADYSDFLSISSGAQVAFGDSGGGVFHKTSSGWKLYGVIVAFNNPDSRQPGGTAALQNQIYTGSQSYFVDLSTFQTQIVAKTAVPAAPWWIILAAIVMLAAVGFVGCGLVAKSRA